MSHLLHLLFAAGRKLRRVRPAVHFRGLRTLLSRRGLGAVSGGPKPAVTATTETAPFVKTPSATTVQAGALEPVVRNGQWRVACASVAGPYHVRQGRACEDTAAWFVWNDVVFLVLADGAGSAAYAQLGSSLATGVAVGLAARHCLTCGSVTGRDACRILRSALHGAERRIRAKAASLGVAPEQFACTFISVLATPRFVAAGQVGDGAVVIGDGGTRLVALTKPAKGEFANETSFLGSNPAIEIAARSAGEIPYRSIAVLTDGLERLSLQMPAGTPHPGFFTPLFSGLRSLNGAEADRALGELLRSERVAARSDDDKTLLVAQIG